ncbi:PH domain-containing protein [Plasmodiophora brassicae]
MCDNGGGTIDDVVADHLAVAYDADLRGVLPADEGVRFTAAVVKVNRRGRRQQRALVVTQRALYNFRPGRFARYRRRIALERITGVVLARDSNEVVFQVVGEYDYRYDVVDRIGLLEAVGSSAERLTGRTFLACIAEDARLASYVLTKRQWRHASADLLRKRASDDVFRAAAAVAHPTSATWFERARAFLARRLSSGNDAGGGPRSPGHEGWLTYRDPRDDAWRQKFAVMRDMTLALHEPHLKGSIDVAGCRVTTVQGDDRPLLRRVALLAASGARVPTRVPAVVFSVRARRSNRTIRLGASDDAEADRWTRAIRDAGADTRLDGWLLKQDPVSYSWRRRYVVLVGTHCWYFEMGDTLSISLLSFNAEAAVEAQGVTMPGDPGAPSGGGGAFHGFRYRFVVHDGRRAHHLAADSLQSRNHWVTSISSMIGANSGAVRPDVKRRSLPIAVVESLKQVAPQTRVVLVVSDVQGSTRLWDCEPDAMNASLEDHDRTLRALLKAHSGYEVKTEGDAFLVAFFNEPDAIRWCIDVQQRLLACDWPEALLRQPEACPVYDQDTLLFRGLRVRMGIHSGTPSHRRSSVTTRIEYSGPDVHLAYAVSGAANGGQILLSGSSADKAHGDLHAVLHPIPGLFTLHDVRAPQALSECWIPGLEKRAAVLPALRARPFDPLASASSPGSSTGGRSWPALSNVRAVAPP